MVSVHFSPASAALTVESARRALYLWLWARQQNQRFTLAAAGEAPGREELAWLGLDPEAESDAGDIPDWAATLPPIVESEPSPWGQWSGRTSVAELRELGVLPEALINFLALLGWQPPTGPNAAAPGEIFSREELRAHWSPQGLQAGPLRFDFELLRRINHEWLLRTDLDHLLTLALPTYCRVGWLPQDELAEPVRLWLRDLIRAVLPGLDFVSLLPPRTRLLFDYHAENYLRLPEGREAVEREGAREVIRAFGRRVLEDSWLTVPRFHQILEEVKRETHWRGRNLHQPIRMMLTGLPFGPTLDELIPLIERGAELDLPVHVKSCRQRVLEFCSVFT
ncbi:MAG: hypothetical protein ACE5H2_09135 [Terriglobia bacterium]